MKNLKNVLLIALIVSSIKGVHAGSNTTVDDFITTFSFTNVQKGYQLYIKDDQQTVVYKETVSKNGDYSKRFDLRSLANGSYSIELERDVKIEIKQFSINNAKITYNSNAQILYKPSVRLKNNQLFVSQYSNDTATVEVHIYYDQELIHEDHMTGTHLIGRIYQLAQNKPGSYEVVLTINDRKYYQNFNL